MCSDFLLLNVRSCRHKYYTSAVKELWMVLRKQDRARLLAPYTGGGNGLRLSDFGRAACAFTFAGRLTLS
jgi:hypothetical protein